MTQTKDREPEEVRCGKCKGWSAEAAFCEHCGAPLAKDDKPAKPRPSAERSRAAYELNRATTILAGVRGVFGFFALLGLAELALGLFALSSFEEDDDRTLPVALTILGALLALVGTAGAMQARKKPLPWGVTLAAMCTVDLVLRLGFGSTPFWLMVSGSFTLFAWLIVPNLAKAHRLMKEHADLRIVQQLQGTYEKRAVEPGRIQGRMWTRDAVRSRQLLVPIGIGAGVVAAVLFGAWLLTRPGRAEPVQSEIYAREAKKAPTVPVEPSIAAFEAAWNGNDKEALAGLYAASERKRAWASTSRFLERLGWLDKLPKLGKPELDRRAPDQVRACYEVLGHELRVWWRGNETGWTLGSFGYDK